MSSSTELQDGLGSDWHRRANVIERFEERWQECGDARIADFLPPVGSTERTELLHELIKIDWSTAGAGGSGPTSKTTQASSRSWADLPGCRSN